uniref:glucuronosyltransferase n=1 Tax=Macaca nemestrina TaxID=9545 RepID=A0A2K6C6V9_MACNE
MDSSFLLLIQLTCYISSGSCGKVLVWPTDFSHSMNIETILDELVQRGHEVTVLVSSASFFFFFLSQQLKLEVYPASLTKIDFCKDELSNKKLVKNLQESKFDAVPADAIVPCGELLAELFNIPFVYSLPFSAGYTLEKHRGEFLFPPSYILVVMSELHDQMTFMERKWDPFSSETMGKADIWLTQNSWDFQFPHPLLPNVDFVGGLHCKPAKPLPTVKIIFYYLENPDFLTYITNYRMLAFYLHQFDGNRPYALGPSTQVYKWIPQIDLLGITLDPL